MVCSCFSYKTLMPNYIILFCDFLRSLLGVRESLWRAAFQPRSTSSSMTDITDTQLTQHSVEILFYAQQMCTSTKTSSVSYWRVNVLKATFRNKIFLSSLSSTLRYDKDRMPGLDTVFFVKDLRSFDNGLRTPLICRAKHATGCSFRRQSVEVPLMLC